MDFNLKNILREADLEAYPAVRATLEQRWKYSHYIHGRIAWEHGLRCGQDPVLSFLVGMSMELGWIAVLLLDDILDEDDVRFHAPAAWKVHGTGVAAMEAAAILMKTVTILRHNPTILNAFSKSIEDTEQASIRLRNINFDITIDELEPLVRALGAMSVFATSWALPESNISASAELETCAGQLVNDCNDCFGAKAKRRNYPDLRTHQPTLLSQLLISADKSGKWSDRFSTVKQSELSSFADDIQNEIRRDASPLYDYFNSCIDRSLKALDDVNNVPEQEYLGAVTRITNNSRAWKAKLERLIMS